jgi:hypothetical protein
VFWPVLGDPYWKYYTSLINSPGSNTLAYLFIPIVGGKKLDTITKRSKCFKTFLSLPLIADTHKLGCLSLASVFFELL